MKIDSSSLKTPLSGTAASQRAQGATSGGSAKTPAAGSGGGKGAVDLSPAAIQLSNLHNGDNDVNMDRVNEIRAAIASGELKIDTSRIADGLIASARDLLK